MLNFETRKKHLDRYDRRTRRSQRMSYCISAVLWLVLLVPLVLWWGENSRADWMLLALGCASICAPLLLGSFIEHLLRMRLDRLFGIVRTPQGMRQFHNGVESAPKNSNDRLDKKYETRKLKAELEATRSKTSRTPDIAA